ncbi:MAG: sugar ABC transporter substrate-binding protein [Gammaproteobacteria bacterium]|uniref:ABC transporter substrate-binding protein n=1 Tax=Pseudomaricurvus alcaniphilus TaxID=1166482 RepID=UPI0014092BF0|nr:sugar ABC transporter substrate-binding protein [Pseudomaricurvus alcaniphilus]MBR9913036.1 sugar ABC transporter substrate-binding protein [Gammaproteobacteria bacterium]NHN39817.1 sugar ABC transporter substrate-binding protein [Pseudomaricurvus alcaniphilus]
MKLQSLIVSAAATLLSTAAVTQAATTVTIGTVNNGDMIVMQKLSARFEAENPDIDLNWVVLEENVLRQRLTTDIATGSGQFDVVTIGTYEVPIWGGKDWLVPLEGLPGDYDLDDVLQSIRDGLSHEGKLYALPFYAESSMTFYNSSLLEKAGLSMPDQPTWDQVKVMASKIHDPGNGVYGICLRGKPGWGENMALVSTMVNTFGGRWFDENWKPELDSPEWQQAVGLYIELQQKYGPPGASSNGFNENQALFSSGKCGIWIDATSAAGGLYNRSESQVADNVGFAQAPVAVTSHGNHWLWSWALAIPKTSDAKAAAQKFMTWATSKSYIEMVGASEGWASVPPGTRKSTYANPKYKAAAPFAPAVLEAIQTADPTKPSVQPVPYTGVQYVGIPEFQSIGTQVGQTIAGALAGQMTVKQALKSVQSSVSRTMRRAGYPKK